VQTHVAENHDEVAWVARLFPGARSYLDVYERFGLLRPRSMYAHCIHLDPQDRARMAACGAAAAVCPTSNLFLGSGLFDFDAAEQAGFAWGLASDVGGGTSFSPFRTMLAAYEVARLRGVTLSPSTLWFRHTLGAARAMDLGERIGNLEVGMEADFVALDACATPLLARRTTIAWTLEEWLFALIVLGDDRVIRHTVVLGEPAALSTG
jgi:guanine deaminase